MSTVVISYNSEKFSKLPQNKDLINGLVKDSADILHKRPEEVIVYFQPHCKDDSVNSPDIMIRGETSPSRRNLIRDWANKLLNTAKSIIKTSKDRIAVKTYVVDSEWSE